MIIDLTKHSLTLVNESGVINDPHFHLYKSGLNQKCKSETLLTFKKHFALKVQCTSKTKIFISVIDNIFKETDADKKFGSTSNTCGARIYSHNSDLAVVGEGDVRDVTGQVYVNGYGIYTNSKDFIIFYSDQSQFCCKLGVKANLTPFTGKPPAIVSTCNY